MSSVPAAPAPSPTGPVLTFDAALPISDRVAEIERTIAQHQVVVVAGETGSGKTTQLPKMCLRVGRERIGHTQPRRIAARSVAERLADELQTPLGDVVGYQVRFTRRVSRDTQIKVMTDGVLLAEIGRDPELRRYDTLIIDEAHERSLNIDFLLGYLRRLLPRRPELKLIVTSATIDTRRFAEHFAAADGTPAPIVEVSGRSYPVEIRYRPLRAEDEATDPAADEPDQPNRDQPGRHQPDRHQPDRHQPDRDESGADVERDQNAGIVAAVTELADAVDGDILVFCSGEREIRDATEALEGAIGRDRALRSFAVLPLYSRLSAAEQHRVFAAHPGRRIVLSTNVAETSLTVPGIRAVVDTGTARISRYSARTKVQRLPIEPVSRASADQRAGRCGRVAPGVCIRLYAESDYRARPAFTEPEILRTNLASVILKMADAGLGAIADFPFVEPPDSAQITDGLRLLDELGALSARSTREQPRLTKIGHQLSRVPLDPRLGRMLLAAAHTGCLREVTVIVAGMAIQDVRERPAEHREAADTAHRRFWAPVSPPADGAGTDRPAAGETAEPTPDGSDFLAYWRLWEYLADRRHALSGNAFRRMCRQEYLNFLRIREWQDLRTQLKDLAKELELPVNDTPAGPEVVHSALLTGLLSQIGLAEAEPAPARGAKPRSRRPPLTEYLAARGARFVIAPGSSLGRRPPPLVMAGELVETSRLWARIVAPVTAEQIEAVAGHLIKRSYSEPHWSASAGAVSAYEKLTLYGVPIVAHRRVNYGRIDPAQAREIFIRSALVEGDWRTRHHFYARNVETRRRAEELEERSRRRDIVVDDEVIFAFYDARIPADVVSVAHFDRWWRDTRQTQPELLDLTLDELVQPDADVADRADFPDEWVIGEYRLPVDYVFEPGSGHDGVTVTIDVSVLNAVAAAPFTWQVPGLRGELAAELIRTLPKATRTSFVPAPDHARRALAWLAEHPADASQTLPEALSRALRALTGVVAPAEEFAPDRVPSHLQIGFTVVGARGQELARGTDLEALRRRLQPQIEASLARATAGRSRSGAVDWQFGTIESRIEVQRHGQRVVGFPALVDEGQTVGLAVLDTEARQRRSHRAGLRRLLVLALPDPTRWVVSHLGNADKLALGAGCAGPGASYPSVPELLADARLASVGALLDSATLDPSQIVDAQGFADLVRQTRPELPVRMQQTVALAAEVVRRHQELTVALAALPAGDPVRVDIEQQVANLVFPGFVSAVGAAWLPRLPVYLTAAAQRIANRAMGSVVQGGEIIAGLEADYAALLAEQPEGPLDPGVEQIGWDLEELRVSLFAQQLGTRTPVSAKRVSRALAQAR